MKRVTFSVDGRVLEQAQRAAQKRGKPLSALMRAFLTDLAESGLRAEAAARALRKSWAEGRGDSGGRKIRREEAYEDRLK